MGEPSALTIFGCGGCRLRRRPAHRAPSWSYEVSRWSRAGGGAEPPGAVRLAPDGLIEAGLIEAGASCQEVAQHFRERGCRATGDGGHRWPGAAGGRGPPVPGRWPPKGGWCLLKLTAAHLRQLQTILEAGRPPATRTRTSARPRPGSARWCAAGRATMPRPEGCPIPGSPVHTGQSRLRRCMAQSPWSLTRPGPGAVQASAQEETKKNRAIAEPSGIKTS